MKVYYIHYFLSFTLFLCNSRLEASAALAEADHRGAEIVIPKQETQSYLHHVADDTDASIVGSSDENRALREKGTAASLQGAQVSSVVPETHSQFQDGETTRRLSLDIYDPSGLKSVKFIVNLQGQSAKTKTISVSGSNVKRTFTFDVNNVPEGQHSWKVSIVTKSKVSSLKTQTLGPWDFSVVAPNSSGQTPELTSSPTKSPTPPAMVPITPGLQSDCLVEDKTKFNICLDLKPYGTDHSWMQDFGAAKAKWEAILKDDGDDAIDLNPYWTQNRDLIATGLPPKVDDIYISGFLQPYDGVYGVLAFAGPYLMKTDTRGKKRPVSGYMVFDKSDEAWLRSSGIFTNTIIHELGHVLGLGSMWWHNGLHSGSLYDDRYMGTSAQAEWEKICPGGRLPVETYDASKGIVEGTAGGHWDEECVKNEMMTGFVSTQSMPLSAFTIGSLEDMGYAVDYSKADPFGKADLGKCGSYCPNRRELRNLRPGGMRTRQRMSAGSHQIVLEAAAKEMARLRSAAPSSLPDDLSYVAGEQITVYIMDDDGEVKEETVTWDEAQHYAPDAVKLPSFDV